VVTILGDGSLGISHHRSAEETMTKARSGFSRFRLVAVLAALVASMVYVQPVHAAAIAVNTATDVVNASDGLCSLREAITAANANTASGGAAGECVAGAAAGADTISFAANYTITLAPALGQLPAVNSLITINGRGASNTVI
jgi:CSLREA domain-containing protein